MICEFSWIDICLFRAKKSTPNSIFTNINSICFSFIIILQIIIIITIIVIIISHFYIPAQLFVSNLN